MAARARAPGICMCMCVVVMVTVDSCGGVCVCARMCVGVCCGSGGGHKKIKQQNFSVPKMQRNLLEFLLYNLLAVNARARAR